MIRWCGLAPVRSTGTHREVLQWRRPPVGPIFARVCGVVVVMLALSMAMSLILQVADASRVYTVGEVRAQLLERPGHWLGRTVRLHATLVGCPPSGDWGPTSCPPTFWQPALADPTGPGADNPLPVIWGEPGQRLTLLRGLPLVGKLLPRPQVVRWGAQATYNVRLTMAAAQTLCGRVICYEGVLVDSRG